MPKTPTRKCTADEIPSLATRGEDVSAYFNNKFTVVRTVRKSAEATGGRRNLISAGKR
jgi:hypothetical protein